MKIKKFLILLTHIITNCLIQLVLLSTILSTIFFSIDYPASSFALNVLLCIILLFADYGISWLILKNKNNQPSAPPLLHLPDLELALPGILLAVTLIVKDAIIGPFIGMYGWPEGKEIAAIVIVLAIDALLVIERVVLIGKKKFISSAQAAILAAHIITSSAIQFALADMSSSLGIDYPASSFVFYAILCIVFIFADFGISWLILRKQRSQPRMPALFHLSGLVLTLESIYFDWLMISSFMKDGGVGITAIVIVFAIDALLIIERIVLIKKKNSVL